MPTVQAALYVEEYAPYVYTDYTIPERTTVYLKMNPRVRNIEKTVKNKILV